MDFLQFSYVLAVAETKSISRAAERCYMSQPAMTRCINKIESELGVRLFDRSKNPLRLTYAGEKYLASIKQICKMKESLDMEISAIAQEKQVRIIIGIPESQSTAWLPAILPEFLKKHPNTDVQIIEAPSETLQTLLTKHDVDIVIASTIPPKDSESTYEVISEDTLMVVLPRSFPALQNKGIDFDAPVLHFISADILDGQPFISTLQKQGLYKSASTMFGYFNISPKVVFQTSTPSTAYLLATEGLGFTIAPLDSIEIPCRQKPIYCTLFDPPATRSEVIIYRKDRTLSDIEADLIQIVKTQAATNPRLQSPQLPIFHDIQ